MCPLWPFHVVLIYGLVLLGPLWMVSCTPLGHMSWNYWDVLFDPPELFKIPMNSFRTINFSTYDLKPEEIKYGIVKVEIENTGIPSVLPVDKVYVLNTESIYNNKWSSTFNISTNFIGYATARLHLYNKSSNKLIKSSSHLNITTIRQERTIDKAFTYSVITLVSIIYINFGCALDMGVVKKTIKRPVGPVIGFFSQFLFMPVISYGLAKALFPNIIPMQLGMFFTGVSPAGGASNIWTVALGGNLNLSITMTTLSTFAAFAMMPLWIFTLGRLIFKEGNITIPYARIASLAIGLLIPLCIGLLIQKYLPKTGKFMARILKPFSGILILFIIIFAIITNLYIVKLFSWKIIVAGLGLPWLGFVFGGSLAKLLQQPSPDILAIAIETGVQNTGIAILMLRVSLPAPQDDLTTVVPVAVAIMTPLPLAVWYVVKKCQVYFSKKQNIRLESDEVEDPTRLDPLNGVQFQGLTHKKDQKPYI